MCSFYVYVILDFLYIYLLSCWDVPLCFRLRSYNHRWALGNQGTQHSALGHHITINCVCKWFPYRKYSNCRIQHSISFFYRKLTSCCQANHETQGLWNGCYAYWNIPIVSKNVLFYTRLCLNHHIWKCLILTEIIEVAWNNRIKY